MKRNVVEWKRVASYVDGYINLLQRLPNMITTLNLNFTQSSYIQKHLRESQIAYM